MQANAAPQNQAEQSSTQKKVCFFLIVYMVLMMTTRYNVQTGVDRMALLKDKVSQPDPVLSLTEVLGVYHYDQMYYGHWNRYNQDESKQTFITESEGRFRMFSDRQTISNTDNTPTIVQHVQIQILNGQYIDKGALYYSFYLDSSDFQSQGTSGNVNVYLNNTAKTPYSVYYRHDKILQTLGEGKSDIAALNFSVRLKNDQLEIKMFLANQEMTIDLVINGAENNFLSSLILVALMIFSSFTSFSSILTILRGIMELQDNPRRYSFLTIMLTNMWDTVLCILCFILAFKDQLSLLFYIIPAFLYCLLFTNLQPRFMMMIYQSSMENDANVRSALCKFNLYHYGSLFAIYPILIYSNFGWVLFIVMSCIIFPQIYANGFNNTRPDISSSYYTKYLFSRFVLLVYLKCFPGNVFLLKPDYILGAICLCLISIQYGLLVVQKVYGSKKVLPSFLLEPVYDYFLNEELNIEEGVEAAECSICLSSLSVDPPKNEGQLQFQPNDRLMKTPCNHHYHSHCLLVWMKIKMECPQCRFKLPPFE